ncbi:hypothetical protein H6P81_008085 [Aristolochia fimbriata]|uniref:Uncharacterized protein n=1 Tax=Aristolochia fimbriata TaxID=158543 RepID=A0AAV7F3A5_ARIFI|nr:hypothetical protein H6P81_008085 [Aristolochia fimbriata]
MSRCSNREAAPRSNTGLQIVKDEKFYSRLISRETSAANNSCRVYYGVAAGAVPFVWESQPGTPKNPISSSAIPPLTPPPSYLFKPKKKNPTKRHHSRSNLFMTMMPKLGFTKKSQISSVFSSTSSSSSSSSSASSSSSWSVPSSPVPFSSPRSFSYHGRSRFSSPRSSFSSRGGDEDHDQLGHDESPSSGTLCFGFVVGRESRRLRGCYSMVIMKSALSSIIRSHGSAQGAA